MWKRIVGAMVLALVMPVLCVAGEPQAELSDGGQQWAEYEECPRPEVGAPEPDKPKARAAIVLDVIRKNPERALDIMELLLERKMAIGLRAGITTTCADYFISISGNEKFDPPMFETGRIFGDFR
jgi:hypothetical protein